MMNKEQKKILAIAFIALLFAIVAYTSSGTSGIGIESDPVAMANISTNWYAWLSGGGVSFNGSPVDLNKSLLYNGIFNSTNYTITTNTSSSAANVSFYYLPNHTLMWVET